jgi:hypothetical protein
MMELILIMDGKETVFVPKPKEETKKSETRKWWRAKMHEEYWFIYSSVEEVANTTETDYSMDELRYRNHNYFRTEEDAKLHCDFVKATMEAEANVTGEDDTSACVRFDTEKEAQNYLDLRIRHRKMVLDHIVTD